MPSPESESPDESFFNDLSRQAQASNTTNGQETQQDCSKAKRIACVLCRKRKLRCDGARPACSTCKRLSHDCAYDEVRKKSGPKRGYVKHLEQRLQQVETLLKSHDTSNLSKDATRQDSASTYVANTINQAPPDSGDSLNTASNTQSRTEGPSAPGTVPFRNDGASENNAEQDASREMIGLGLEESLPPQDVMDDLYEIYFSKVHPLWPMMHKPRFFASLNLAPHMRPPICLRYIMWTLAASVTDKYVALQEHFYQRARKYAQSDEIRGHGEGTITIAHAQMWILSCCYEFRQMYFPRAWLSVGRGVRLAQMMQLHRVDGIGLDVKQCLPPPKDWTEREERRRTFWVAFCADRYASIGTGWPMTIDERDIMTDLPASEEAFDKSMPMSTGSLDEAMTSNGAANLQSLGLVVLTAAMFGRNLLHLHRPGPNDNDSDINGGFWNRHRQIEQVLLQTSLALPGHLRLPSGLKNPNVVFANMCIHTSVICLHQAAIFKAGKYRLPASVSNESKIRCVTAAAEIASIMRMISHMDLDSMNPFLSFCVYVAARVFVQYLKTRPTDQQMSASLHFLLQAMQALRRKNPLTDSFLVQLDVDLESAGIPGLRGIPNLQQRPYMPPAKEPINGSVECSPLINIRDPQNANAPTTMPGNEDPITNTAIRDTQYTNNTPGPLFNLHNINSIDMNTNNAPFISSQLPSNGLPPPSSGLQDFTSASFAFHDGNMMDLSGGDRRAEQPSPTTLSSQSRGGSTSQSSYSPGQRSEHHIPYRASPKMQNSDTAPRTATIFPNIANNQAFAENTLDITNNMETGMFNGGFLEEWEYNALQTGTGMTPMEDASWDAMLESVTIGWDAFDTSRNNVPGAR